MEQRSRISVGTALVALAAAASLALPAPAGATTPGTHAVSGTQSVAACLTPSRCVIAGYTSKVVGDVVAVTNGVPGRTSVVHGSQSISGVSCPTSKGCWALVRTSNDTRVELVSINPAGVVTGKPRSFPLPNGAALFRISCVTLTRCVLVGNNIAVTPPTIEVATFNGRSLTYHQVAVGKKALEVIMQAVSCDGASCDAVGYLDEGASSVGVSLEIRAPNSLVLHTIAKVGLDAVSCISPQRCYAAGTSGTGGVVLMLASGVVALNSPVPGVNLSSIACVGSACTAAGEEQAQSPSTDVTWGAVVPTSEGVPGTTGAIEAAVALTGAATAGGAVVVVGGAQGPGSIVGIL
jgi:hypothetical protein